MVNVSYLKYLKGVNATFINGRVYGICGKNSNLLGNILNSDIVGYSGEVFKESSIRISYIVSSDITFYTNTVKDEFELISEGDERIDNIKQIVVELFYKLGLNEELYYRKIYDLSRSEKYLIKIVLGMISNPNVIIFNNIFSSLDLRYRKKIMSIVGSFVKDNIVILIDDDVNVLYSLTDYIYVIKSGTIIIDGETEKVYKNVEKFFKLKIEVPYLCDIVYKAENKKGVKLKFRKDVRDTMKDIYRNV